MVEESLVAKRMEQEKARMAELEAELEELKFEKEVHTKEQQVKRAIEELHPSIKHTALTKIEAVLGEEFHKMRGTPEERAERRKHLKEELGHLRHEFKESAEKEREKTERLKHPAPKTPEQESPMDRYSRKLKMGL
jgi:hypothetical protein